MKITDLNILNDIHEKEFIGRLGGIYENSPWVARKVIKFRPFCSLKNLHEKMVEIVAQSPYEEQLELIRSHPDLGANIEMSEHSVSEQQQAGLKNLTKEEYNSFHQLNEMYKERFKFPFIFAVKGKDKHAIHLSLKERVNHAAPIEFQTALNEIYKIAYFRLKDQIIDKGE